LTGTNDEKAAASVAAVFFAFGGHACLAVAIAAGGAANDFAALPRESVPSILLGPCECPRWRAGVDILSGARVPQGLL
jgi:hypothetical protein